MPLPHGMGPHRRRRPRGGESKGAVEYTGSLSLSPKHPPAGTQFTIHLKGGGWTETANIYMVDYGNTYLGHACAFNSQGDMTVNLPTAGEPGWHFIDLYPGIYKGTDEKGIEALVL